MQSFVLQSFISAIVGMILMQRRPVTKSRHLQVIMSEMDMAYTTAANN
jgi:hypothetical protein